MRINRIAISLLILFMAIPSVAQNRFSGYYKDLFMDCGVAMNTYESLPAADLLGLSVESIRTYEESGTVNASDYEKQLMKDVFVGSETDENGPLLYPDGAPRFRMIYVAGGKASKHGSQITGPGLDNIRTFYSNGGSYVGTCAGGFICSKGLYSNEDGTFKDNENYLGIWPGYTVTTLLYKSATTLKLEPNSPLLKYSDFGGDMQVDSVRHNGGCYIHTKSAPKGTQLLMRYQADTIKLDRSIDREVNSWAYKASNRSGRLVITGSHPEQVNSGERLDLFVSMIRYAMDGNGDPQVKACLSDGETREMTKSTRDGDPSHTRIGDLQYHHFLLGVPDNAESVTVTLSSPDGTGEHDLYLFASEYGYADNESAHANMDKGSDKTLVIRNPKAGLMYISVYCDNTVEAVETKNGPKYSGRLDVLNGVPYVIKAEVKEGKAVNASKRKKLDRALIDKVADWQIRHHPECVHGNLDWTNGALYRGMYEWAEYSSNQDVFDFLKKIGEKNSWGFNNRLYHADDICVGQTYAKLYEKYGDEKMITSLKNRMDKIVQHPSNAVLRHNIKGASDRWSWCDALFMAPPVYAEMYNIFKDEKYLQYMDREFKLTTDSLFNRDAGLYYRDCTFIPKKEANGCDVYWGRGNGWVFGGLALLLEALPKDHYTYGYYLDLFRTMAESVVKCQDINGSWHASMLDPESYPLPENSGSGFFTFGLAWGVNHGILTEPEYKSAAQKGWAALKRYVNEDGFLGYVQAIGAAPGVTGPDKTEVYGVGAFLLAGTQMMQMTDKAPKAAPPVPVYQPDMSDRAYWVESMTRIVEPFYVNLSQGTLRKNMPVESRDGMIDGNTRVCTYLEGLGRSFDGIAPWLNLGADDSPEGQVRARFIDLVIKSIANAVDPSNPDYMDFSGPGTQPLVDAAFFAQGLLRSKDVIWPALDETTRSRVINELKASRKIKPYESNWLMFSATVEAALLEFTGEYDERPVDYAFSRHAEWYKGDGWYGDGPSFHLDYYNSYVIQPMLLDVSAVLKAHGKRWGEFYDIELPRIIRYAEQQERLISPEGTYPVLGRSSGYRFGCFQALSQVSLMEKLPLYIEPSQVRCALTAVIKNQLGPGTFDENGWLTLGFCGHQPGIADSYVTTGSAYLCTFIYLPLGLPAENAFWIAPEAMWSSKRTWNGLSVRDDHSL